MRELRSFNVASASATLRRALMPLMLSILAVAAARVAIAEPEPTVFRCHYDLVMKIDGDTHSIRHQDSVRDGSFIPLELQRTVIHLRVSDAGDGQASVQVSVFDRPTSGDLRERVAYPAFTVALGAPTRVSWSEDAVSLELAVAVSKVAVRP